MFELVSISRVQQLKDIRRAISAVLDFLNELLVALWTRLPRLVTFDRLEISVLLRGIDLSHRAAANEVIRLNFRYLCYLVRCVAE
jgi:hypothetical protein